MFNQCLSFLPSGLEELYLLSYIFSYSLNDLPSGLKKLSFSYCGEDNYKYSINNLPENLEELEIYSEQPIIIENLPSKIKKLSLGINDKEFNFLPDGLEELEIGVIGDPGKIIFPEKLKKITIKRLNRNYKKIEEYISTIRSDIIISEL